MQFIVFLIAGHFISMYSGGFEHASQKFFCDFLTSGMAWEIVFSLQFSVGEASDIQG